MTIRVSRAAKKRLVASHQSVPSTRMARSSERSSAIFLDFDTVRGIITQISAQRYEKKLKVKSRKFKEGRFLTKKVYFFIKSTRTLAYVKNYLYLCAAFYAYG
jgi:hypothetical protein